MSRLPIGVEINQESGSPTHITHTQARRRQGKPGVVKVCVHVSSHRQFTNIERLSDDVLFPGDKKWKHERCGHEESVQGKDKIMSFWSFSHTNSVWYQFILKFSDSCPTLTWNYTVKYQIFSNKNQHSVKNV